MKRSVGDVKYVLVLSAMVAGCALMAGCSADPHKGYSFGTGFPKDVKSVSVPVFKNTSTTPGLETMVTESVIKELQRSSGLKVTAQEGADTVLRGAITDVEMRRLSVRSGTGLIQELAYQITVDFDWKDERSGAMLTSRRKFTATDTFVPATGVGERIETGQQAAAARLARDLVGELRAGW